MGPKVRSAVFKAPLYPLKRRRTKKLHRELLDQLEFYMSESNIRHDAFMREKVGENGMNDVPISIFLSFPLIQEMKVDEKNVIGAIENSIILELDESKTHLRRRYPVTSRPANLDNSTLYIENLPSDCTIAWLKEVCQKTGTVRHVSLPRYKKSDQVKGFAFIEYSSPEDVMRACRILKDPPRNFFPSRTSHHIARIKRRQQGKTSNNAADNPSPLDGPTNIADAEILGQGEITESRKRKRSEDAIGDTIAKDARDCPVPKDAKRSKNEELTLHDESPRVQTPSKKKSVMFSNNRLPSLEKDSPRYHACNGDVAECSDYKSPHESRNTESDRISSSTGNTSKRRRSFSESSLYGGDESRMKRLKEVRDNDTCNSGMHSSLTTSVINALISQARHTTYQDDSRFSLPECPPKKPSLQSVIAKPVVRFEKPKRRSKISKERKRMNAGRTPLKLNAMPKVEWLELKREYKKLQKQNMSKLKMTIQENNDAGSVFIKKHLDVLHSKASVSATHDAKGEGNFVAKEHPLLKRGPPRFQPGVIAKISPIATRPESLCPDVDGTSKLPSIEEVKEALNSYGQGVAYVDLKAGDAEGYVRFNDGESAQRAILEEKSLALCLLTGVQEEKYWDKLLASRSHKFSRERKKTRGRTKILAKAEALVEKGKRRHIRFDKDYIESIGTGC